MSALNHQVSEYKPNSGQHQERYGKIKQAHSARLPGLQFKGACLIAANRMFYPSEIGTIPLSAADLATGHVKFRRTKKNTPSKLSVFGHVAGVAASQFVALGCPCHGVERAVQSTRMGDGRPSSAWQLTEPNERNNQRQYQGCPEAQYFAAHKNLRDHERVRAAILP